MDSIINNFYDNIEDFNASCGNDARKLRVFQWNICSMNDLEKFDHILQTIEYSKATFDVIVICETWLVKEHCSIYNIAGYNSIFSCRNQSHGGLAVFVKDNLNLKITRNILIDGLHNISIELSINGFFSLISTASIDLHVSHSILFVINLKNYCLPSRIITRAHLLVI